MLNLNKEIDVAPFVDEDVTGYVQQRLEDLDINVVTVSAPVFVLETVSGNMTLEILSKKANDLDYAISAINELNPAVLFLYKVIRNVNGYTFRFNYIAIPEGV